MYVTRSSYVLPDSSPRKDVPVPTASPSRYSVSVREVIAPSGSEYATSNASDALPATTSSAIVTSGGRTEGVVNAYSSMPSPSLP